MAGRQRAVALVVMAMVLPAALVFGLAASSSQNRQADWSTLRTGPHGTAGAFGTLRRLGYDVRRLREPLTHIPSDCRQLWVIQPLQTLTFDELAALRSWVTRGGCLVCSYEAIVHAVQFLAYRAKEGPAGGPFPELVEAVPAGLGAGLTALPLGGPSAGHRGAYAVPWLSSGLTEEVKLVYAPRGGVLSGWEGWTPLAVCPEGPVVAARSLGNGHLLFLADPDIASNSGLARADNAVLISNIVAAANGPVFFDEFHHGFSDRPTSLRALVMGSPAALGAGIVALGVLLGLLSVAVRFGSAAEPYEPPRRSALEFVSSVADLYERAGARDGALRALYAATLRRLGGPVGPDAAPSCAELAELASERVGIPASEIRTVLEAAHATARRGCTSDAEFLTLARGLARVSGSDRPAGAQWPTWRR